MMGTRFLMDTSFIQALLNRRDQHHRRANDLFPLVRHAAEVWVTEAVLIEVANAFSKIERQVAAGFIERCYNQAGLPGRNLGIVSVDTSLLRRGLTIYEGHHDKQWGLTDCISFVVMKDRLLTDALTADRHFVQAGFRALMLEEV
jgi:predicted nucleic acid-binding protein